VPETPPTADKLYELLCHKGVVHCAKSSTDDATTSEAFTQSEVVTNSEAVSDVSAIATDLTFIQSASIAQLTWEDLPAEERESFETKASELYAKYQEDHRACLEKSDRL